MWQENSALTAVESYFQKDEKARLVQKLPWNYAISAPLVIAVLAFISFATLLTIFFSPLPAYAIFLLGVVGFLFIYHIVTRTAYKNYCVITQYSVYRYIDKQIQQIDELPLNKIKSITVKQLRRNPDYALIKIRCQSSYIKQMPYFKRLYGLKTAQKNPEKADMRSLSLGKPVRLHLICKNPRDAYMAFSEAKNIAGYTYTLHAKGRNKCKKSP